MKLAILTGLILSASCQVLHQPQVPLHRNLEFYDTPNYQFAYSVNDGHTGDIKSQHESRRGETVLGQYSLLQPDGVTRTVDYTADEHAGFRASVNNGRPAQQQVQDQNVEARNNLEQSRNLMQDSVYANIWPSPRATPAPAVAVSRSSIVQTFSNAPHYPYQQQVW